MRYRNPVIPGFYPDPSVCRVGEDYYLANSSFEFFPGVPLYHSRDLASWEQIGHALTRESQLDLTGSGTSGGVFAPTIRYHAGKFYVITTVLNFQADFAAGESPMKNLIVQAENPAGPWSDPVPVDHPGIDPSLFWDDDGRCYLQGPVSGPEGQFISQFEIDPDTGEKLGETRCIWKGSGGKCPEGPHLYKINGIYYLMIAEGGTEWGHMETIARSDSVWGPFEGCPRNPIVTHRNYTPSFQMGDGAPQEFGCVGHADLVDDPQGNWWMVLHGVRPSQGQLHHIGRETLLAPVTWEDGWPVVNGGRFLEAEMEGPGEPCAPQPDFTFTEDFTAETRLPPRWASLRGPLGDRCRLAGGLALTAGADTLDGLGRPSFVGVRQRHLAAEAETALSFDPADAGAEAGLTVFHTNERHYDLIVSRRNGGRAAFLRKTVGDMVTESEPVPLPERGRLRLAIQADQLTYRFLAGGEEGPMLPVGEGRTQLLSTEAMAGTFTGCFFGLFCQGQPGAAAVFESLIYRA